MYRNVIVSYNDKDRNRCFFFSISLRRRSVRVRRKHDLSKLYDNLHVSACKTSNLRYEFLSILYITHWRNAKRGQIVNFFLFHRDEVRRYDFNAGMKTVLKFLYVIVYAEIGLLNELSRHICVTELKIMTVSNDIGRKRWNFPSLGTKPDSEWKIQAWARLLSFLCRLAS